MYQINNSPLKYTIKISVSVKTYITAHCTNGQMQSRQEVKFLRLSRNPSTCEQILQKANVPGNSWTIKLSES